MVTDYRDENDTFMLRLKRYITTGLWDHVINDLAFDFDGEHISEVRRLLTDNKHHVIKAMLELIKELSKQEGYDDLDYVMSNLMPVLDDIGLDWPEIRVIRNSIWKEARERMLREPDDDLNESAKVSNMLSKRWTKIADRGIDDTRSSGDISHIRYMCDSLLSSGAPASTVDEILRMNIDVVLHALKNDLEIGKIDNAIWATTFIKDRFPGAYKMIIPIMNDALTVIAKRIDKHLDAGNLYDAAEWINRMIKAGMDPVTIRELKSKIGPRMLDTIKKGITADGFTYQVTNGLESMEQIGYKPSLGTGKIRQRLVDDFRKALVTSGLTQGAHYGALGKNPNTLIKIAIKYGGQDTINLLKDVIEEEKATVLRQILALFRTNSAYSIYPAVTTLRHFGFKWPELDIIEKSLKSLGSNLEEDEELDNYGRAWRANLEFGEHLQSLEYDLRIPDNWEILALTLEDIGHLDVEQVLPPRSRKLIEDNKKSIIRSILFNIKEIQNPKRMAKAVLALNNMGFNWPELDVIWKSLESTSESIEEEYNDRDDDGRMSVIKQQLWHNLPDGNYWTIGKVVEDMMRMQINRRKAYDMLDGFKEDIIEMEEKLLSDDDGMAAVQAGLSNMRRLVEFGVDWPELTDLLERNRTTIMRATLREMLTYNRTDYGNEPPVLYADLRYMGVNWSDLDIVEKSIKSNG